MRRHIIMFCLLLTIQICVSYDMYGYPNSIRDSTYGISFENINDKYVVETASNDNSFCRLIIRTKDNNFIYVIYAERGELNHAICNNYDSVYLKNNYKQPYLSKDIELYTMKGLSRVFKYEHLKRGGNYVEYIKFDLLFKIYAGNQEYFYVIYTYSNNLNDPNEAYISQRIKIVPPGVSFWDTTIGSIFKWISYVGGPIGCMLFGLFPLRNNFSKINHNKKLLKEFKYNKIDFYQKLCIHLSGEIPNITHEKMEEGANRAINIIIKDANKHRLRIALYLTGLLLVNAGLYVYFREVGVTTVLIFGGIELGAILVGSLNIVDLAHELLEFIEEIT